MVERKQTGVLSLEWELQGQELLADLSQELLSRWNALARIEALETEVLLLKERFLRFISAAPLEVQIETFAPDDYEVLRPLRTVVRFSGDNYIATFFDANISASGDTPEDAVWNLKDVILETYEILQTFDKDKLGLGPSRQKSVLEEHIQEKK